MTMLLALQFLLAGFLVALTVGILSGPLSTALVLAVRDGTPFKPFFLHRPGAWLVTLFLFGFGLLSLLLGLFGPLAPLLQFALNLYLVVALVPMALLAERDGRVGEGLLLPFRLPQKEVLPLLLPLAGSLLLASAAGHLLSDAVAEFMAGLGLPEEGGDLVPLLHAASGFRLLLSAALAAGAFVLQILGWRRALLAFAPLLSSGPGPA